MAQGWSTARVQPMLVVARRNVVVARCDLDSVAETLAERAHQSLSGASARVVGGSGIRFRSDRAESGVLLDPCRGTASIRAEELEWLSVELALA